MSDVPNGTDDTPPTLHRLARTVIDPDELLVDAVAVLHDAARSLASEPS